MKQMKDYEFWFVVGSQSLYGQEVLDTVAKRAAEMADELNAAGKIAEWEEYYKAYAKELGIE